MVVPVPVGFCPASHTDVYKARRGDTLVTIADRFGVSLDDLHRWNHLSGTSILAGQRVRVSEPARVAPHTRDRSRSSAQAKMIGKGKALNRNKSSNAAPSKKSKKSPSTKTQQSSSAHKAQSIESCQCTSHEQSAQKYTKVASYILVFVGKSMQAIATMCAEGERTRTYA